MIQRLRKETEMDKLSRAQHELREMDALAAGDSPVHRLNPLCTLLVTIF